MSKDQPSVAVVGLGVGVTAHVPTFRVAGFDVAALGARRQEALDQAAQASGVSTVYTDYDALLAHPGLDAVAITTPPPLHRELVLKAFKAGKHVLLEKPFAMSSEEAAELRDAAKASGLTAMTAEAYRFAPSRAYVTSLLAQGYVGRPRQVSITYFAGPKERPATPGPRTHWRTGKASGGGFSGGPASTFFDSVVEWFGPVAAIGGKVYAPHAGELQANGQPADADEIVSAMFETAGGLTGAFAANAAAPFGEGARIEIVGDEGRLLITQPIVVPSPGDAVFGGRFDDGPEVKKLEIPTAFQIAPNPGDPKPPVYAPYRTVALAFKQGIATGVSPTPNFEEAYHLRRITDALRESSETGRLVRV